MTQEHETKYVEELKGIRMSADARARMRARLSEYAKFHPVRVAEAGRLKKDIRHAPVWTGLFTTSRIRTMNMYATFALALMVATGGTAYAAQQSLPGDALYPVKLHVNENVRSAFAVGANAEAELQADLLETRVEEAVALEARGELSGDVAANVATRLEAQARETRDAAMAADADVQTEIRTELATSLGAHTATESMAFAAMSADDASAKVEGGLGAMVSAALGIVLEGAAGSDTELAGEINVLSQIEQAETRIDALRATIDGEAGFAAEARAEFAQGIEAATTHITEARTSIAADARAAAEASVNAANVILGDMESALSTMGEVEIDANTGAIIDIDLSNPPAGSLDVNADGTVSGDAAVDATIDAAADAAGAVNIGN